MVVVNKWTQSLRGRGAAAPLPRGSSEDDSRFCEVCVCPLLLYLYPLGFGAILAEVKAKKGPISLARSGVRILVLFKGP